MGEEGEDDSEDDEELPDAAVAQTAQPHLVGGQPVAREGGTVAFQQNGADVLAVCTEPIAQDSAAQVMSDDGWSQVPSRKNRRHPHGRVTGS